MLTAKQVRFLLGLLAEKYGIGYSDNAEVAQLQVALSIMLEVKTRAEAK